jgi:hypothetical protein
MEQSDFVADDLVYGWLPGNGSLRNTESDRVT